MPNYDIIPYNNYDIIPYKPEAYRLFHEGAIALAGVEHNGLKIDVELLDKSIAEADAKIISLKKEMSDSKVVRIWKKRFGDKFNLDSNDQLAKILFDVMGHTPTIFTNSGNPSTTEKALATVKEPFVKLYTQRKKWQKARKTYLGGIKKHLVGDMLRPSFNLHLAVTFRSSADAPSFQNMPIRVAWVSKLIRSLFIAPPGYVIVEIDYKGVEVCFAACYHKDPNMLSYIEDKTKDMHRDMACQLYFLKQSDFKNAEGEAKDWMKAARHAAKNKFVFPAFYGSVWFQIAPDLWEAMRVSDLKNADGVPMVKHLANQGITELGDCNPDGEPAEGTYAAHVRDIEKDFWQRRFPDYAQWKRDWYDQYKQRGWMQTKNGFILQGYLKRNEVINYPVQGPAFHALLWSLIELELRELPEHLPDVKIAGQIHDCMIFYVPIKQVDELVGRADEIMTQKLRKAWPWVITPLEIEVDVCPEGGNWFQKKGYKK